MVPRSTRLPLPETTSPRIQKEILMVEILLLIIIFFVTVSGTITIWLLDSIQSTVATIERKIDAKESSTQDQIHK